LRAHRPVRLRVDGAASLVESEAERLERVVELLGALPDPYQLGALLGDDVSAGGLFDRRDEPRPVGTAGLSLEREPQAVVMKAVLVAEPRELSSSRLVFAPSVEMPPATAVVAVAMRFKAAARFSRSAGDIEPPLGRTA
jgi:hypothetical protein